MSSERQTENCPVDKARNWDELLRRVCEGLETRRTSVGIKLPDSLPEKRNIIERATEQRLRASETIHRISPQPHMPLSEAVGKSGISNIAVGGRLRVELGFRDQALLQAEIDRHMSTTRYISQIGHESDVDQIGKALYVNWTRSLKHGTVMLIGPASENFVDPFFGDCQRRAGETKAKYGHKEMQRYTRRWTRVFSMSLVVDQRPIAISSAGPLLMQ